MPELQDIFNNVRLISLSPVQSNAFNMIRSYRTETLGSHAEICTDCGSVDIYYNSYRNRHCPKCQHAVQEHWVDAQMAKSPGHVVRYLGRHTHRVAIANSEFSYLTVSGSVSPGKIIKIKVKPR